MHSANQGRATYLLPQENACSAPPDAQCHGRRPLGVVNARVAGLVARVHQALVGVVRPLEAPVVPLDDIISSGVLDDVLIEGVDADGTEASGLRLGAEDPAT